MWCPFIISPTQALGGKILHRSILSKRRIEAKKWPKFRDLVPAGGSPPYQSSDRMSCFTAHLLVRCPTSNGALLNDIGSRPKTPITREKITSTHAATFCQTALSRSVWFGSCCKVWVFHFAIIIITSLNLSSHFRLCSLTFVASPSDALTSLSHSPRHQPRF